MEGSFLHPSHLCSSGFGWADPVQIQTQTNRYSLEERFKLFYLQKIFMQVFYAYVSFFPSFFQGRKQLKKVIKLLKSFILRSKTHMNQLFCGLQILEYLWKQ